MYHRLLHIHNFRRDHVPPECPRRRFDLRCFCVRFVFKLEDVLSCGLACKSGEACDEERERNRLS